MSERMTVEQAEVEIRKVWPEGDKTEVSRFDCKISATTGWEVLVYDGTETPNCGPPRLHLRLRYGKGQTRSCALRMAVAAVKASK